MGSDAITLNFLKKISLPNIKTFSCTGWSDQCVI